MRWYEQPVGRNPGEEGCPVELPWLPLWGREQLLEWEGALETAAVCKIVKHG